MYFRSSPNCFLALANAASGQPDREIEKEAVRKGGETERVKRKQNESEKPVLQ